MRTFLATIGVAALVVVGIDTVSYAATGDTLIMGKYNKSDRTTHVTSTGNGPALSLHAKGDRPALAIDSATKVVRLNADRVDGQDAAALQNTVRVYTATSASSHNGAVFFYLPTLPAGSYLATYSVRLHGATGSVASPTSAECQLTSHTTPSQTTAFTSTTAAGIDAGLSGSGVVVTKGERWFFACTAYQQGVGNDDFEIVPDSPVRVTLTRIDRRYGGVITPAG